MAGYRPKGEHYMLKTDRFKLTLMFFESFFSVVGKLVRRRDDGGLLPDAYLHLVRKKAAN